MIEEIRKYHKDIAYLEQHRDILADALSEIKAGYDNNDMERIRECIDWCINRINTELKYLGGKMKVIVDEDRLKDIIRQELAEMTKIPYSETRAYLGRTPDGVECQLVLTRKEDEQFDIEDGDGVITFGLVR